MVGHACPGPLGGEGTGFRSRRYEQSGDFSAFGRAPHYAQLGYFRRKAARLFAMKRSIAARSSRS